MQLTTKVNINHSRREIDYNDCLLLLGSCFSENMSQKLQERYFRVSSNPFGVLYNPLSIAQSIDVMLNQTDISQLPLCYHNGLWHSMLHHGSFSQADKQQFISALEQSIADGRKALLDASVVIVTFGTAWIYKMNNQVVGNCHKLPQDCFSRQRLTVEEITTCWQQLLGRKELQGKHFIFTVSPIRHLKDGLHQNQLSKSTLLLATEQLASEQLTSEQLVPSHSVTYFPSYEIMLDELRDYRFYNEDMLHPSQVAVNYIWERFEQTYFSEQTIIQTQQLRQLYSDLHHRPLHPDSEEYLQFQKRTQEKARALQLEYPWIMV